MERIIVWIKEVFVLANADFNLRSKHGKGGSRIKWGAVRRGSSISSTTTRGTSVTDSIDNERPSLKVACPFHNSTNFQMPWFALPQTKDTDTIWQGLAEDAPPRRHAEISPVKIKDTRLMNNKLPPAENLCGECDLSLPCELPLRQHAYGWHRG